MPNSTDLAAAQGLPKISRRKALGFLAAASVPPTAAVAEAAETTARERADHHWKAFVEAMNELTADFDGWIIHGGAKFSAKKGARVDQRSLQSVRLFIERKHSTQIMIERHSPLSIRDQGSRI